MPKLRIGIVYNECSADIGHTVKGYDSFPITI
jgi:hypothetical protein